ncbi:MAG: hypothetical protein BWY31_03728 [Lentisphaerae bacterium ADurb.Bin242]|nr:MAG: hypothetical protein BWY31_03728 [Lentisphaerae bacterium ADurb.Bin242]
MRHAGPAAGIGMHGGHDRADVPHVGGGGAPSEINELDVGLESAEIVEVDAEKFGLVVKRHIAGKGGDGDIQAEGEGGAAHGTVELVGGVADGFRGLRPDLIFEFDFFRDDVDDRTAALDDAVNADGVLVAEGVALGVDGIQRDAGGGERVDSHPRAPRMGGPSPEDDFFHDESVGSPGRAVVVVGMGHERHVHVVEDAEPDEFGFSAEIFDFFQMVSDPALFRGTRDEGEAAGQVFPDFRERQRHGGAGQRRDLHVMPAGVGGMGLRIGLRVLGHKEGVEFTENGDGRSRLAGLEVGADAGPGQLAPDGEIQGGENVFDPGGGLEFLVAGLRILPELDSKFDQFLFTAVDFPIDPFFEFVFVHGVLLLRTFSVVCFIPAQIVKKHNIPFPRKKTRKKTENPPRLRSVGLDILPGGGGRGRYGFAFFVKCLTREPRTASPRNSRKRFGKEFRGRSEPGVCGADAGFSS